MTLREDFVGGAQTGNAAVFVDDGADESWSRTEVATRTPDEVLDDLSKPPVSVLKIDVEGQEERLLAGAQTTVSQNRPIVFAEWNAVYYSRRGIDVTKATAPLLRSWDYRCLRRCDSTPGSSTICSGADCRSRMSFWFPRRMRPRLST